MIIDNTGTYCINHDQVKIPQFIRPIIVTMIYIKICVVVPSKSPIPKGTMSKVSGKILYV